MRLFVAVRFSDEVNQRLMTAIRAMQAHGRGNFSREENLHLTLAFIGETENFEQAKAAVSQVYARPFTLTVERIGKFGDLYWAGIKKSDELSSVQKQTAALLRSAGFSIEDRTFKPHLTLVRNFHATHAVDFAEIERSIGRASCTIRKISLMESRRINGRLTYTERYALMLDE